MSTLSGTPEPSGLNRAPVASQAPQVRRRVSWRGALVVAAAAAALLAVFAAYLDPHFMRDVADFVWQCF